MVKMATLQELKNKRAELAKKFQKESEKAAIKRDIVNIQEGRNKVNPTGWQKLSSAAKPYIASALKSTGKKGKKKSNWDFSGGLDTMMGTSGKKSKKMPIIF